MNQNEKDVLAKKLLTTLASHPTRQELRESIGFCNEALEASNASSFEKRAFFQGVILKAQDNTASMSSAGEAQEIVNQLLGRSK